MNVNVYGILTIPVEEPVIVGAIGAWLPVPTTNTVTDDEALTPVEPVQLSV